MENGVSVSGSYIAELWGNPSGGVLRGIATTHLLDLGISFDLEKLIGWKGASVNLTGLAPLGRDLSTDAVGNHFTVSNIAAYSSVYLFELWFQQNFCDDRLSIRFGQLAADEEFAGAEYAALFLNSTFGWPPFLSGNLPNGGPAFPKGTPGLRVAITPMEWFRFQMAIYQGDPFSDPENRHGMRWHLSREAGWTLMNEAGVFWNSDGPPEALPGAAKLGFWAQSAETPDAWTRATSTHSGNYGGYVVLEQMIYRKLRNEEKADATIGWFARAATNPQNRNTFGYYFDTGFEWRGAIPERDTDAFGLAFAYGELTRGARRTLAEEGARQPGAEMVIELTYQCQVNPWLALQPDLQYVINPGATGDLKNALVLGLRATVSF